MALASPSIEVVAEIDADLRHVRGTLRATDVDGCALVDPLAALPDPPDDRWALRTWPGRHDRGELSWDEVAPGEIRFTARLPRRYGDTGTVGGLHANGTWLPVLVCDGRLPAARWDVRVSLPPDTLGVLGGAWGVGEVGWTGTAPRASLAVLPHGQATPLGPDVWLATRGAPRRALVDELSRELPRFAPDLRGVVVEGPLRRRLARPGSGVSWVSDRAFRVTPGLRRIHRVAVTRGVAEGLLAEPDPLIRSVIAAHHSVAHASALEGLSAARALRWGQWLPQVDALLTSRSMPYYAEILEDVHPGDPVRDDLLEVLSPHWPGTVVLAQVRDRWGDDAAAELGTRLAAGEGLEAAATAAGVDAAWLGSLRSDYPRDQDYLLEVGDDSVRVRRDAPPGAPAEVVTVRVDGTEHALLLEPGERARVGLDAPPDRVVLDPAAHLRQVSRRGDRWPPVYRVTLSSWISALHMDPLWAVASGTMTLRRRDDTHNLWIGSVYTNSSSLLGVQASYLRKAGPLLDGYSRRHAVSAWVSPALLRPSYAATEGGDVAVGAGVSWRWETRTDPDFPLRGHRLRVAADGGFVPGSWRSWLTLRGQAIGVVSPHPRWALVTRLGAATARGDVEHRLLSLGGLGSLRSLPACFETGTGRLTVATELRWAPIRHASIPALIVWGSELQLTAGAELGGVWREDAWHTAAGVTAGASVLGDLLGVDTSMIGVTTGWPVGAWGLDAPQRPQLFVRWGQAF